MKYTLKENSKGKKAKYLTTVDITWVHYSLDLVFEAKHSTFNSYSDKYNDNLYDADVCELFLYTGIKDHYYEIEVAPNGTLFFGEIFNDGKTLQLTRLVNDAIYAKVETKGKDYTVNIHINLKELKGDRKELWFNCFRIETDGEKPNKHLFAVNPTMCMSFHKREFFIPLKEDK